MRKGFFFAVFLGMSLVVTALAGEERKGEPQEQPAQETVDAEEGAPATELERRLEILKTVHEKEMKRLEARKEIGVARKRDDIVEEAEEMMAEARKRYAAAVARYQQPEKSGESEKSEDTEN